MIYYATYRFGGGNWQPTIIFESKIGVKEMMDSYSKKKDFLIALSEEELERKRKERDRQKTE